MHDTDPNMRGNSRRWIVQEVEASLRRLQTDWIDLYQIHRWDPGTDARGDARRADRSPARGEDPLLRLLHLPAVRRSSRRNGSAEKRNLARFVCEQPPYSILVRGVEAEVLPICERYGMGVIPWSPLAGGWLSGRFRKGAEATSHRAARIPARYDLSIPGNQQKLEAVDALAQLADGAGISLVHLALAFVIRHPAVTAAIVGPRTLDQLEGQWAQSTSGCQETCSTRSTRSWRRART